jgi:hypothetical protein
LVRNSSARNPLSIRTTKSRSNFLFQVGRVEFSLDARLTSAYPYNMKLAWTLFAATILLMGCSVYRSDGRKYLESNGFVIVSGSAVPNLENCGFGGGSDSWTPLQETPEAWIFTSEDNGTELHVVSKAETPAYGCDFKFQSGEEREQKLQDALDLTLLNYVALPKPRAANP